LLAGTPSVDVQAWKVEQLAKHTDYNLKEKYR